jgi:hypothetical protein
VSYDNYHYFHNHHAIVLAILETFDPKVSTTINVSIIYWLAHFMLVIRFPVHKIHMQWNQLCCTEYQVYVSLYLGVVVMCTVCCKVGNSEHCS